MVPKCGESNCGIPTPVGAGRAADFSTGENIPLLLPRMSLMARHQMARQGANDVCSCGSGKKFKKCCRGAVDSFSSALAHHQKGELTQAAPLYERVLSADPSHAEELLARAAELKPASAPIYHSLAVALQAEERWEDSANAFARAISLDPAATQSILHLGVTLRMLG